LCRRIPIYYYRSINSISTSINRKLFIYLFIITDNIITWFKCNKALLWRFRIVNFCWILNVVRICLSDTSVKINTIFSSIIFIIYLLINIRLLMFSSDEWLMASVWGKKSTKNRYKLEPNPQPGGLQGSALITAPSMYIPVYDLLMALN